MVHRTQVAIDLANVAHQAKVKVFADAVRASHGAASVWWDADNYVWCVRAETPSGMHFLEVPAGGGFPSLEVLLRSLAGEGIEEIKVEFNGISPIFYDSVNR